MKKVLIIGGTSGLGLSLAEQLSGIGYEVFITGRSNKSSNPSLHFHMLNLSASDLHNSISNLINKIGNIDVLIYAAGFLQWAKTAELSPSGIDEMIAIGLTAPVSALRSVLNNQKTLELFVPITSTSEWTPRDYEPLYTAVKGGLGMYAKSVALDDSVKKILVAAPAGMRTAFWNGNDKDTSSMLDTDWVAGEIIKQMDQSYRFRHIKILREPPRVDVDESR
jgi:NAD(P)-dependent dehydrogenase (short-subunit alcohol dehydrogenase family)